VLFVELFLRFLVISLLAFGGGQAALPLVEQVAVRYTGWVSADTFGVAIAFGYLTPGPVLIVATFVGFYVAGLPGALAATAGAFLAPWALAGLAAREVQRLASHRLLRAFGVGAAPAIAGLMGLAAVDLTRQAVPTWPFVAIAFGVAMMATWQRMHPFFLLAAGAGLGWLLGL
jgi:chromate transporter